MSQKPTPWLTRHTQLTQLTQLVRHPAQAGVKSRKREAGICHLRLEDGPGVCTALAALQSGDMGDRFKLVDSEKTIKLVQIKKQNRVIGCERSLARFVKSSSLFQSGVTPTARKRMTSPSIVYNTAAQRSPLKPSKGHLVPIARRRLLHAIRI